MLELLSQAQSKDRISPPRSYGLLVVRRLLDQLDETKLPYCHWKSNEHVGAGLDGLTDLDILVDRRFETDLQRILVECGFRRFSAPPLRAYPAIEDYLGFDYDTGCIVHLHLHFQLTLGEAHLKGYRLPWEARLLATRRRDSDYDVDVADPALEILLLLVRGALKSRLRDRFRLRKRNGGDFEREFAWLQERASPDQVIDVARDLLGATIEKPLRYLLAEPAAPEIQRSFARTVRASLRRYRTYGPIEAQLRAWLRELQWVSDAINRRYLHRPVPLRRVSPRGGTVIVLLGSDGSGKSTLSRTLMAWLGVKLDVIPVYFGSGDGHSAWYRTPLKLAHRLLLSPTSKRFTTEASKQTANMARSEKSEWSRRLRAAARVPWALALSCEKRGKLRRMIRARNRGIIVICDRYPQGDVVGFNDGPLLAHWRTHPWSICRALAAWEAKPYTEAALDPPDLVIKLTVAPEVAVSRRPEMTLEEVGKRDRTIRAMSFSPTTKVSEIDGNAPLEVVVLTAKRLVWREI